MRSSMFRDIIPLLIFCSLCTAWAGDDEVHFKAKAYTPRNAPTTHTYSANPYSPQSATPSIGGSFVTSGKGTWNPFSSKAEALADKTLPDAPMKKEEPYKQQKHITASTMSSDPKKVPEKKPFDEKGKKLTEDAAYKAPVTPHEKNPLLTPRQGIKVTE